MNTGTTPKANYTADQIEAGHGCYADRPTYLYTDSRGNVLTDESKNAHIPGYHFCGRRDPDGTVIWC